MTVDVATLVFEFKSDSAGQAEKAMDRLIAKGDQLDATAKKVRRATDSVNEAHRGAAGAAERAAQGATALAQAEGAAEKAARGAAQASAAVRAQRQLEARAMAELVQASKAYERDQVRAAKALDAQISSAMAGHDRLNGSLIRNVGVSRAATQAGLNLSRQAADVGVQFAMAAQSAHPLQMILMSITQQGPQIADALTTAKTQGVGFGAAMKSLGVMLGLVRTTLPPVIAAELELATAQQAVAASALEAAVAERAKAAGTAQAAAADEAAAVAAAALAKANDAVAVSATRAAAAEATALTPLAVALGAVAAAAAVAFGGAALAARDLNKENRNLVDGLGLTQKQLDHLKDKGVNTAVTIGDVFKGTFNFIREAIAPALAPVAKWFGDLFDAITSGAVKTVKVLVGGYVGAFEAIKQTWSLLPRAMSDIGIQTANALISATEWMVNKTIAGFNRLIEFANAGAAKVGLSNRLDTMSAVDFGRIKNWDAGAAAKAGETAGTAFRKGFEKGGQGVDSVLGKLSKSILDANAARVRKAAGDPGKTPKGAATPRDQSDERTAQIAAQVQQALQDELQARRAITRDATGRAEIERQIVAAALAEKQARIDQQIASIQDPTNKSLDAAAKAELVARLRGVKLINDITASLQGRAIDEQLAGDMARDTLASEQASRENQIDLLAAQANLMQSAYARSRVEVEILEAQQQIERLKLEEVVASATSTANEKAIAQARLQTLAKIQALQLAEAKQQTRLVNAIGEATDAVRGFKNAFRRHDWARVFDELQRTIETIQASFAANGLSGGLMTAGSAAASLIGGKGGRVASNALGIAGLGAGLGTLATGASLGSVGLVTGLTGSAALGGAVGSGLAALGAVAAPIAIAAAALYAAAKIFNLGGKPTNAGAGYDLRTGAISGNKRTSETEQAATSAGQAIQGIQDALKAAGIGITDAVTGLVIGTRDATQIYLQSGKMLTSAVGDSGAAVDTAMRALLSGATYVSEAQKKLVDSAVAAGKGFDEIANILAAYEGAQKISGALADQILQLTDPKAFDLKGVTDDIAAQRKAYQQLATDGYLTADQLMTINGQLATLEGLKLDEVLKRYADSVSSAADDNAAAIDKAGSDVLSAYDAFASAKKAEIDALRQSQEALKAFRKELDYGSLAGRGPTAQLAATRREFERLAAMDAKAPERVANLQSVSQAFIEASKAASPTELAFQRDIASVRRATEASEIAVGQQADIAQQQLDAATAQLTALGLINNSVLDLATTMKAYLALTGRGGAAANDNVDYAKYLADNKDLGRYAASNGLDPLAFAKQHYLGTGQYEIAAGIRKFATGGTHPGGLRLVGEEGPELEATGPARIYSARDTARMISGGSDDLVEEIRALRSEVASLRSAAEKSANATTNMDARGRKQEFQGVYVRGETPGDAVKTEAA